MNFSAAQKCLEEVAGFIIKKKEHCGASNLSAEMKEDGCSTGDSERGKMLFT